MFVRKIVDWISYNKELNSSDELESVNEDLNENFSTSSLGGETSVLDYYFMAEGSSSELTNHQPREQKITNGDCQKRVPFIQEICGDVSVDSTDTEKTDEIRADEIKTKATDSGSISNLEFKIRTLPSKSTGANNKRSIFTQTDRKLVKRQHSSITSNPYLPLQVIEKSGTFNLDRNAMGNEHGEYVYDPIEYGTLFVFGCNGTLPTHLVGEMASKYVLRKRLKPNGLKEAFSYSYPDDGPTSDSSAKHVISYPVSNDCTVVVAYTHDTMTDMFQIGRYEKPPIDFRVSDTRVSDEARNGVSRFACRIVVNRDESHEAKVYAAAFDSSHSVFLGESGLTYYKRGKVDGFTTNGVLIMHPSNGVWREVSVCGFIYPLRSETLEPTKRPRILEEKSILQDGTLIDLCGVTLLWRTPEGLKKTPNGDYLIRLQGAIHREVPECRLLTPELPWDRSQKAFKKAYVYLSCGHLVGLCLSRPPTNLKGWSCPVCRVIGPISELMIGVEPGFYIDRGFPEYVFKPCGHAASKITVEYWSHTKMPNHRNIQDSFCPFCRVKLNHCSQYVKLTLPDQ